MIALPPFHTGAITVAVRIAFPPTNEPIVGASGIVYGIPERLMEACEFPAKFFARIVTIYESPLFKLGIT